MKFINKQTGAAIIIKPDSSLSVQKQFFTSINALKIYKNTIARKAFWEWYSYSPFDSIFILTGVAMEMNFQCWEPPEAGKWWTTENVKDYPKNIDEKLKSVPKRK